MQSVLQRCRQPEDHHQFRLARVPDFTGMSHVQTECVPGIWAGYIAQFSIDWNTGFNSQRWSTEIKQAQKAGVSIFANIQPDIGGVGLVSNIDIVAFNLGKYVV